ncbi:unnamed protein product [Notodromas monacha]|uniref:AIG1-type G domain-containing protein n=1 Tax=Notodromas monacha TaxID=399045 RepID=A0A7R9G9W5_9CRUS|nr:unnamed protein product [Notodromas monacha]CAG0914693.1 unnamed protein product [Notodromas monacha]
MAGRSSSEETPSQRRGSSRDKKTLVLVGTTGVGKSSLGNVLLGLDPTVESDDDQQQQEGFVTSASTETCTEAAECRDGFWLGNTSKPVRIFDTPGHGDANDRDYSFRESLAESMRREKHVHAFIWVKNFEEPRFDHQDASFFNVFSQMFGNGFMRNLVVVLTRYNYSSDARRRRQRANSSLTRTMEGIRNQLRIQDLPIFAIDALHDPEDETQSRKFQEKSAALWDVIRDFSRQPVSNVQAVKTELEELNRRYKRLQKSVEKKDEAHAQEIKAIKAKQKELRRAQKDEENKWESLLDSVKESYENSCAEMRRMSSDHQAGMKKLEEQNAELKAKYQRQKKKVEDLQAAQNQRQEPFGGLLGPCTGPPRHRPWFS